VRTQTTSRGEALLIAVNIAGLPSVPRANGEARFCVF
jgi:hypothetical protein